MAKKLQCSCEDCIHYAYDEEYDSYYCEQAQELDEDEMERFLSGRLTACPFYHGGSGDYVLAKKQ